MCVHIYMNKLRYWSHGTTCDANLLTLEMNLCNGAEMHLVLETNILMVGEEHIYDWKWKR